MENLFNHGQMRSILEEIWFSFQASFYNRLQKMNFVCSLDMISLFSQILVCKVKITVLK